MKVKRSASTRVVARSAGKQPPKKLAPLILPEDDDSGSFRSRNGKKRSKETAAKAREAFDVDMDIDLEDLADKDAKKINSKFKSEFAAIKKQIETQGSSIEDAAIAFSRTSLSLITDLMPLAEGNYRNSGKEGAAYVISTLINQARDLSNDIRLNDDVSGRIDTINMLIHSGFVRITELMLREVKYNMSTRVDEFSNDSATRKLLRQAVDDTLRSYIIGVHGIEDIIKQQIAMFLQGHPNYLNPVQAQADEKASKKKGKKIKKKKS